VVLGERIPGMVDPRKMPLLPRWRTRLRAWWEPAYWWTFLAIGLWPVAYALPPYLLKSGHHPPVGTYIAILGGLVAAVTLRKEPPLIEKAAWVLLITLVMFAEIRNLYVVDQEQTQTFSKINGDLTKTGEGLDKTLKGLDAERTKLGTISDHIDGVAASSEQASDTAKEAVNTITGGGGVCFVEIAGSPDPNVKAVIPIVEVVGKYPLSNVTMRVTDYRAYARDATEMVKSGKLTPANAMYLDSFIYKIGNIPFLGIVLLEPIGIDLSPDSEKNYNIEFYAINGNWREYLRARKVGNEWVDAIRVNRFNAKGEISPPAYQRINPALRKPDGTFDWEN
jgi:hypothetical protein